MDDCILYEVSILKIANQSRVSKSKSKIRVVTPENVGVKDRSRKIIEEEKKAKNEQKKKQTEG